jgi:hypothetical protein
METAMASTQSSAASTSRTSSVHHLHAVGDICPLCDQPIPHDRADEIAERLEAREREQSAAITSRLTERFETEKIEALEAARLEAEQKVATAREEARLAAEAQLKAKIDAAEQAHAIAQAALRAKSDEAEAARSEAAAAQARLQGELDTAKLNSETALAELRAEAAEREAGIRLEAEAQAAASAAAKIAEAEAQKASAEQAGEALKAELETTKLASSQALEQAQVQAAAREVEVRAEATAAAVASAQATLSAAEQAKAEAEAKAAAAEAQAITLQQTHKAQLDARLQEQREALEADKTAALNAEKSAAFEERLKLSNKVEELSRALEKKTAEDLGEGAEIDLYEDLKAEFGDDRIDRVGRGHSGADIVHTVMHNGRECGKIIYDSKNHGAWRNEFVSKLKTDQMAEKADHAILSTRKFPANGRHLQVQDGVIIASPARVVALVQIVRAHLIHTHTLRMSNEARAQKTAELYFFITSQQCADMFARLDELAESLLEIQAKEMKAHESVWKQQGLAIRAALKVQAEFRNQIESIIGTASASETDS